MLNILPIMLLSNAQKNLPTMLNIILMITAIMPQFVYDFNTRLAWLASR